MKRHSKAKQFNYILKLQCDIKMSSAVMLSWFKPTAPVRSQQHHSPLHSTGQLFCNTNQTQMTLSEGFIWDFVLESGSLRGSRNKRNPGSDRVWLILCADPTSMKVLICRKATAAGMELQPLKWGRMCQAPCSAFHLLGPIEASRMW